MYKHIQIVNMLQSVGQSVLMNVNCINRLWLAQSMGKLFAMSKCKVAKPLCYFSVKIVSSSNYVTICGEISECLFSNL